MKIFFTLLTMIFLCSCAVIKQDYYFPEAGSGFVEKESCRGQVGADNTLVLGFEDVVAKISIDVYGDKRFFSVVLTIPDGTEVIWPQQAITAIADNESIDLTISSFARVVSRGDDFKTDEYKTSSVMKNLSSGTEDDYFESILLPTKDYKILTIENIRIIVNEEELIMPSIRFKKSSGFFLHPLNC